MNYDKKYLGFYQVTTKSSALMLRDAPSTSGTILKKMPKGSFVYGLGGVEDDFMLCQFVSDDTQVIGFASTQYLTKVSD